jgi:polysaccharide deacetylase 2 family uncharacterized protein YibQ
MPTASKPEKKTSGSKGRAPSPRGGAKRPARPSKKAARPDAQGVIAQIQRPRFLPFLTVWLLAVAMLAGLIHWGDTGKSVGPKARSKVASASRQATGRAAEPSKAANSRVARSSGASSSARAKSANDKSQTASNAARIPSGNEPPSSGTGEKLSLALSSPSPPPFRAIPPAPPGPPLAPSLASVAIVIDDFGGDMETARKFLALPFPITLAILPHLAHSREVANLAHSQGYQVMLHLPMQPLGYPKTDPGKGALLLSMSPDQIAGAIAAAVESCPHLVGINNHMGSKFTEDADHMKWVLQELGRRGLFFLDSHTSARSVAYSVARELRLPSLRRDVFLDHTDTEEAVQTQLEQLVRKARIQGSAIAIGHPHESTYKVLSRAEGLFRKEGITVVPAGQLITSVPIGAR